jgi:DNA polymerase III epsilon subunit-like protein
MSHVTVFDCEHLTNQTSPQRFWCGPDDPDPLLVQIGAVHLSLDPPFGLREAFDCIVRPVGRDGPVPPPEFFTKLTGIDGDRVAREGVPLSEALEGFASFTGGAPIFSWGKDEITSIAPACFVEGIVCPIPVRRFGNAASLLLSAGVPLDVVHGLRSHTLPAHFGLEPETRGHDGAADARGVARVLSHLLSGGRLSASDFALPPGGT